MSKRLIAMLAAVLTAGTVTACDDNAQDHSQEAAEELREGDMENADESAVDASEDLQQGDTTELIN